MVEEILKKMEKGEELHAVHVSNEILNYVVADDYRTIQWGSEEHTEYTVIVNGYKYIIEDCNDGEAIIEGPI